MNYYPFHIGDYAAHTKHLSLLEDLAYRRLLDKYYLDEELSETCPKKLARLIGMHNHVEEVQFVLENYFKKTKKGYKQERIENELREYRAKADRARANGAKGGRPKQTQKKPSGLAKKTESKTNQEPRTNNQEPNKREGEPDGSSASEKKPQAKKFQKPSLAEITQYFFEKLQDTQKSQTEAQKFFNHYESNGWKVGKNPMKSWTAAASGWISRMNDYENPKRNESEDIDFNTTGWSSGIIENSRH